MSTVINIKGTYDTPAIEFDPEKGLFTIKGRSLPSNSFAFYAPVLEKVKEYLNQPKDDSRFDFRMDFISSSSTKVFQELFYEFEQAHKKGTKLLVNWYYKFGDDDMKELGDDLRMDTSFPFEFIAYE